MSIKKRSLKVRVRRQLWMDKKTQTSSDVLTIRKADFVVVIPFEQARRICDELHDACDERDRELRGAASNE